MVPGPIVGDRPSFDPASSRWNVMRTISSWLSAIAAAALVGCGGPAVVESTVPPPAEQHGGILVPLADDQAYVELLNGQREMKGRVAETTLVAYVLQPDRKTPFAETPTSVEIKIGTPKGEEVVPLKAAPDPSDPLGNARFLSKTGPYELNQNGGEVTVQVGGKTLSGKFRGPR
jgi:hypothetical protein